MKTWGHQMGVGAVALLAAAGFAACSSSHGDERVSRSSAAATSFPKDTVDQELAAGDFTDAFATCQEFLGSDPTNCDANYCSLIASTLMVVDSINNYVLPTQRNGPPPPSVNQQDANLYIGRLQTALTAANAVTSLGSCEYDLASMPLLIGDASDPIMNGEVRGTWTTRTAAFLGAVHSGLLYDFLLVVAPQPVPLPDGGGNPDLPPLLATMKQFLQLDQSLLLSQPTTPGQLRGGWFDRDGDNMPDSLDELLIDIFVPGTHRRVFDFSTAEFVPGQSLPELPLTPTFALPPEFCGYQKFHIDDLASGANVSSADGITISPSNTQAAIPLTVNGKSQLYTLNLDGTNETCITCGQPGNNDGARWRPVTGDVILFVSTRDHANAIGGDGAGIGQELYAMRPDGSNPTRLTFSDLWATNYHANWSPDGRHIVWGRTESRAWDVMVADFVEDARGMRLVNQRRIVHDTTWWETHGFTPDEQSIITTNTRAGFLSADVYAINLATGFRKRLTNNMTWDEHAHLSPTGRKLAWISSRYQPAAVAALNDGSLSPVEDFFWIVPGIFWQFGNPPAGYTTELTLMDTDGTNLQQLTFDNEVVADNQWSADGKRIIFRQTNALAGTSRIRLLTFDDCLF